MALLKALQDLLQQNVPEIKQEIKSMPVLRNSSVAPVQANVPQVPPIRTLPDISPQQNGFKPMQLGGGRFKTEEDSTFWNPEAGTFEPKPEDPWYKRALNDPALMARLAMGFNTMRLNPDQGLNAMLSDRIKTAGEIGRAEKTKNKTLVALQNMGLDQSEVDLLGENPELLKVAATAMYKKQFGGDVTADLQTFAALTKGMSDADKKLATRIKLGLDPRATSVQRIDLGTSWGLVSDGILTGTIPKDLAGVKVAEGLGTDIAGARSNYGSIKDTVNVQKSALQAMLNDPAVDDIFGTVAGATPSIRQSSVDAEARLGQIKGGAFLQAIQSMRGMGALSNAEGEAATRAATALNLRMSPEAAKEEMRRMMAVLDAGQERALRNTRVDENEVPSYMKDWKDTYSSAGKPVKIGGSTITEVKE
jgi:hypothetical protein